MCALTGAGLGETFVFFRVEEKEDIGRGGISLMSSAWKCSSGTDPSLCGVGVGLDVAWLPLGLVALPITPREGEGKARGSTAKGLEAPSAVLCPVLGSPV